MRGIVTCRRLANWLHSSNTLLAAAVTSSFCLPAQVSRSLTLQPSAVIRSSVRLPVIEPAAAAPAHSAQQRSVPDVEISKPSPQPVAAAGPSSYRAGAATAASSLPAAASVTAPSSTVSSRAPTSPTPARSPITVHSDEPPPPSAPTTPPSNRILDLSTAHQHSSLSKVMIFAAEVSAISGHNPHKSILDVFTPIWQRTDPESYNDVKSTYEQRSGHHLVSVEEEARRLIEQHSMEQLMEEAISVAPTMTNSDFSSYRQIISDYIDSNLQHRPPDERHIIQSHIIDSMSREKGVRQEMLSIKTFTERTGKQVKDNNRIFYKKCLGTLPADIHYPGAAASDTSSNTPQATREYWAGGRIDGLTDDGLPLEIKNRVSQFQNPLSAYDRVQFQTYLHLLDKPRGILCERLTRNRNARNSNSDIASAASPSTSADELKQTPIQRDPLLWYQSIQPSLYIFSAVLHTILQSKDLQYNFIAAHGVTDEQHQILGDVSQYITTHHPPPALQIPAELLAVQSQRKFFK